jgi:hypothetical protein
MPWLKLARARASPFSFLWANNNSAKYFDILNKAYNQNCYYTEMQKLGQAKNKAFFTLSSNSQYLFAVKSDV